MDDSQVKIGDPLNDCPYTVDYNSICKDNNESMRQLRVIHLNVRSYFKNIDDLIIMLDNLTQSGIVFDVQVGHG